MLNKDGKDTIQIQDIEVSREVTTPIVLSDEAYSLISSIKELTQAITRLGDKLK
jgi:hypothetical protein